MRRGGQAVVGQALQHIPDRAGHASGGGFIHPAPVAAQELQTALVRASSSVMRLMSPCAAARVPARSRSAPPPPRPSWKGARAAGSGSRAECCCPRPPCPRRTRASARGAPRAPPGRAPQRVQLLEHRARRFREVALLTRTLGGIVSNLWPGGRSLPRCQNSFRSWLVEPFAVSTPNAVYTRAGVREVVSSSSPRGARRTVWRTPGCAGWRVAHAVVPQNHEPVLLVRRAERLSCGVRAFRSDASGDGSRFSVGRSSRGRTPTRDLRRGEKRRRPGDSGGRGDAPRRTHRSRYRTARCPRWAPRRRGPRPWSPRGLVRAPPSDSDGFKSESLLSGRPLLRFALPGTRQTST